LPRCHAPEENELLARSRRLLSAYEGMADMIRLGAYRVGSDLLVDEAIRKYDDFENFLRQGVDERCPAGEAFAALEKIIDGE
jgi:flagellum-specific ATP synthase